jgi:hypothetical protein
VALYIQRFITSTEIIFFQRDAGLKEETLESSDAECTSLFPDPHFGLYKVQKSKSAKKKLKTPANELSTPEVHTNSRLATCRSRLLMKNIKCKPRLTVKQVCQEQKVTETVVSCDGSQPSPHNAESPASQKSSKTQSERRSSVIGNGSTAPAHSRSLDEEGCIDSRFDELSPTKQVPTSQLQHILSAVDCLPDKDNHILLARLSEKLRPRSDQLARHTTESSVALP